MNNNDDKAICPICKNKLKKHSELQDKICNMITIKQFANNCPGIENDEIIREVTKVNSEFYHDFGGN